VAFIAVDKLKWREASGTTVLPATSIYASFMPSASEIYYFATTSTVGSLSSSLSISFSCIAVSLAMRFISSPVLRSLRGDVASGFFVALGFRFIVKYPKILAETSNRQTYTSQSRQFPNGKSRYREIILVFS